jgi:probable F420-dependent oxidoreductase
MDIGINIAGSSRAIRPDVLAREVEDRGFESLWFGEHSYIPRRPQGGHQAHPEGDTQEVFRHSYDVITIMTAAAMSTKRLNVGSLISVVTVKNVMTTAKSIATLDILSGGRVLFGVGTGWHPEELANNGVVFGERYEVLREKVLAMQELWTNEHAEFHGKYVNFDPVYAYPRPLSIPRPPVIAGFEGPKGMKMMIEWSDGWCPTSGSLSGRSGSSFAERVRTVRGHLEVAGRDPATYPISATYKSSFFPGSELVNRSDLDGLRELGVSRVMFNLPEAEADVILPLLDRYSNYLA